MQITDGNSQLVGIEIESYNQDTLRPTRTNPFGGITLDQEKVAAYLAGELAALMDVNTPPLQLIQQAATNTAKALKVSVMFAPGWDDPKNYAVGAWNPAGVLMHETFGKNSYEWMRDGASKANNWRTPTGGWPRAAHYLINRDGTFWVMTRGRCYHAGAGGPMTLPASRIANHKDWAPGRKPDTQISATIWAHRASEERAMALTDKEIQQIADRVWSEKINVLDPTDKTLKRRKVITMRNGIRLLLDRNAKLLQRVK